MRTIYYTASSLDGFIATEDDSLEWLFALENPTDSSYPEFISKVGALAMGTSTYLWLVQKLQLQSAHQRGSGFVELRYLVSKSATPKPSP